MKVIMTYRNYNGMDRRELFPDVYLIKESEKPEDVLRKIWEYDFNTLNVDFNNPIDEENSWFEGDMALITWADGDTKEYYVVDVKDYEEE